MADNITIGGNTIATDEVTIGGSGVHVQRVKIGHGVDGAYTADANIASPLPVNAARNVSTLQDGLTQNSPVTVKVAAAVNTTTELVGALGSSKKIRVLSMFLGVVTATGTIDFKSATTSLTGVMDAVDTEKIILPENLSGWMTTSANEALQVTTATCTLVGTITYVEVS